MSADEIKVGHRIKDNDPRMRNRVLVINRIWFPLSGNKEEAKVIAGDGVGRPFPILLRRIHTDGKPRKSGFTLIRGDE